jgi:site-specific DNA recombinase
MSGKALISGQAGVAVLLHGGRAQSFHLDGPAGLDRRWEEIPQIFGDGGNVDRPALQRLLSDIQAGTVRCVVVYKVDRLSRSLIDFARIIEVFEKHNVSFVSVTQQFNTTNSLGRLTLNILLSFAHYVERGIMQSHSADVALWRAYQ